MSVQDIDFSSARKLKENLDGKIDAITPYCKVDLNGERMAQFLKNDVADKCCPTNEELSMFYAKLNQCNIKHVALSFLNEYAGQFLDGSRAVPVIADLYESEKLKMLGSETGNNCREHYTSTKRHTLSGKMLEFLMTSGRKDWGFYNNNKTLLINK